MSVSSEMHNDLAIAFMKEHSFFFLLLYAILIQIAFENKNTLLTNFFSPWFKCGEVDTSQFSM